MELTVRARIPAPPDEVWPWLTDPARMNAWSRARITLLAPGAGGRPDGAGASRRVDIPAWFGTTRLFEEIVESAPPARLVYRVVRGPALLRDHRGDQRLCAVAGGTEVTWHVRFSLALPLIGRVIRRQLRRQLRESLDALAQRFA